MTPKLTKGTRVKVEYTGELLRDTSDARTLSIKDDAGLFHCYQEGSVTLTEQDPDNWPPVRGDVWKTETGKHYHYIGDLEMKLRPSNGRGYEDVSLEYVKVRKPVLVFREGGI